MDEKHTWSCASLMTPEMLVMLITLEVKPGVCDSRLPLSSNPKNAVVTKNIENVLIEYRSPH
jgi:hypothetical protein